MKNVVIIDYGMGNIRSLASAVEYLGLTPRLSSVREEICCADFLLMPGVGSYARAMERIRSDGIDESLREAAIAKEIPLLGICLGMQLLARHGTEDGMTEGLGFIDGVVDRFVPASAGVKIPHVGFAPTRIVVPESPLFRSLPADVDFYYTHSYRMVCAPDALLATGENGETFAAAVGTGTILGVQFHPELSQTNGLRLLHNFFTGW
jgi:glutamine amidotransferase